MTIYIPEIGAANYTSVERALTELGYSYSLCSSPKELNGSNCDALLLCGVGNFGHLSREFRLQGWDQVIRSHLHSNGIVIGICAGFQILCERSEEANDEAGLGIIKCGLRRLPSSRVPVIGFKETISQNSQSIQKINKFYYTHSFGIYGTVPELHALFQQYEFETYTLDGIHVLGSISSYNIRAVQYHPEKSGLDGLKKLKTILWGV
jgi:imidazole glycerol phosphate synthase glutamine amidotransferase subunit